MPAVEKFDERHVFDADAEDLSQEVMKRYFNNEEEAKEWDLFELDSVKLAEDINVRISNPDLPFFPEELLPEEIKQAAESADEEVPKVVREKKVDSLGRSQAHGARKRSKAVVYLKKGTGEIYVNQLPMTDYFASWDQRAQLIFPFEACENLGQYDVWGIAWGGGTSGQAGALRLAISRALLRFDPDTYEPLTERGYLTRDQRQVEPKKFGRKKARKGQTFKRR